MTEVAVHVEDISKLKDADELKQAYIGLKDTNRYSPSPRPLFFQQWILPTLHIIRSVTDD